MPDPIEQLDGIDATRFRREIMPAARPVVLRGLAAEWPAVRACTDPRATAAYLRAFDRGGTHDMLVGALGIGGRFFYDEGMTGLNFERRPATLPDLLARLDAALPMAQPPALAVQSLPADEALPGFASENRIGLLDAAIGPRLWIGNRVVVSTHHDVNSNIAVVVTGRRRFTLFPPDQVGNLYMGPFEFTPAGTPVSLVDLDRPDHARFPRFAAAMAQALEAELGPGDALYIPYMWWHHVRSLEPFNLLVNYWWNEAPPPQPGLAPVDAMIHALLCFAGLPDEQKAAWRAMIDHVVFDGRRYTEIVPAARQGIRGPLDDAVKRRLRQQIARLLAS